MGKKKWIPSLVIAVTFSCLTSIASFAENATDNNKTAVPSSGPSLDILQSSSGLSCASGGLSTFTTFSEQN